MTLRDSKAGPGEPTPVDLELEKVLGDMPRKTYTFDRKQNIHQPLSLPRGTTAAAALDRVLRLPAVHSKRFLTTKVDRCVTGKSPAIQLRGQAIHNTFQSTGRPVAASALTTSNLPL